MALNSIKLNLDFLRTYRNPENIFRVIYEAMHHSVALARYTGSTKVL